MVYVMKIKDRLEFRQKGPVLTFKPDHLVSDAIRQMTVKNFGACVVVDQDQRPIGIVSERDFMKRLLDKGLDPKKTILADVMTTQIKVGREDDDVVDWMRHMSIERFRHLPIVDEKGKLVGLVSQGDFVSYTWPDLLSIMKDRAIKSIGSKAQIYVFMFGVLIYSAVMLWLFKVFE